MFWDRVVLALLLALLGWMSYKLITRSVLQNAADQTGAVEGYYPGNPAILYFSSVKCSPCEAVQKPVLDQLKARNSRLQLIEIDALKYPEMADRWGILSLPTTFLIDSSGKVRGVNHGVVLEGKIAAQFQALGEEILFGNVQEKLELN
jgi:thiol-disulfide isomerase/thioredoxin